MAVKPHRVAKTGVGAMVRRRATVVPGFLNKATVFFDRLMPRSMQLMIVGTVAAGRATPACDRVRVCC